MCYLRENLELFKILTKLLMNSCGTYFLILVSKLGTNTEKRLLTFFQIKLMRQTDIFLSSIHCLILIPKSWTNYIMSAKQNAKI